MGILKHVVLPAFGLVHAASIIVCKDVKSWGKMVGKDDDITEEDSKSLRQNHMVGALRGFNAAMLTLCGFGIFSNACHSDARQAIAYAETILFAVVSVDAYRLGGLNYFVPGVQSLFAFGGTVISYMEPGIFTKDHNPK
uniref:Transmembrane protein 107 n=1 Tax=Helicotheca tamesis TaxID=374047 RepID=A0A7S2GVN7_9STRA|mmetsp:Transcript_12570/g.17313  ORF Transcript_12570/g.17313 Transcript_12570/m.17313 type:complete len:139 (+) Transcript_12570:62-478(+)|eukprot:CAMPEP_0185734940 /NCGR_PEP_ID=MMETSP1171-20130828/23949_1 /TAXON_ID=374046 /ORGANISM="Helicotheca tamensis, Strain CCMP826" /LENGTH=138 /DNA_ID=CAMNT_0028405087 /DNA_START=61 /DNA_END=477 /DNA_ORIENTATION=-